MLSVATPMQSSPHACQVPIDPPKLHAGVSPYPWRVAHARKIPIDRRTPEGPELLKLSSHGPHCETQLSLVHRPVSLQVTSRH